MSTGRTAVILAGGKGTRLARISGELPKPMVELDGKPVLQYLVELCAYYDFTEIILLVGHKHEAISSYFGNGEQFGVSITYHIETEPLGTSGGVAQLKEVLNTPFLVLYGDVVARMDLNRLWNFHHTHVADATLVLHPNDHPVDSDLVELDANDRVVAFHSKPHQANRYYHNMVNAAAYVISPQFLDAIPQGPADFGKDVFPNALATKKVMGYVTSEYLKDMGTPDRWEKVENDLKSGKVERRWYKYPQKAIFLDRDGVINPDLDLIHRTEDFSLYPYAAGAIKKINKSEYLAIVVTNQSVVARNLTDEAGVRAIHAKMEHLLGEQGAYVDAVYYCPHHPHGGFEGENPLYKVDCDCRKPKPGMLLQAAERYNLDLSQCLLIGDAERDIQAGKAVGCTTYGVKTGKGLKSAQVLPDFFCKDLEEAVALVFNPPHPGLFAKLERERKKVQKHPFVIAIAGNSRSGKSTLSTWLSREWESQGLNVLRIELDDWILPKSERPVEKGVWENFQLHQLVPQLKAILAGQQVVAGGYARHPERKRKSVVYAYANQEVVLIEGIVALSTPEMRALSDFKLFLDIPEQELFHKINDFYTWKGHSPEDIQAMFNHRLAVEYRPIADEAKYADLVLPYVHAQAGELA